MRRLVIALIVLAAVLVAVDFGSAALAESAVSRQMREQIGLTDDPEVRVNGFPFLTQALGGHYGSIDVDANRIRFGDLQDLTVHAQLRDVSAPLPMLLGSGAKTLRVSELEGTVRVPAADVSRLVPDIEDLRIENLDEEALEQAVEDGADAALTNLDPAHAVRLAGTAEVLGEKTDVTVIAELRLVEGQMEIAPRDVKIGNGKLSLPAPVERTIERMFTQRINPGALPLSITPTDIRAAGGGLEISGIAEDVDLGPGIGTPSS